MIQKYIPEKNKIVLFNAMLILSRMIFIILIISTMQRYALGSELRFRPKTSASVQFLPVSDVFIETGTEIQR